MAEGLFDDCMSEAYLDLENLIYDTAHKFNRTYGGDIDELISRARYYFVKAYHSHEEQKASLVTWVRNRVWFDLFDCMRKDQRRAARVDMQGSEVLENADFIEEIESFDVEGFASSLSKPAAGLIDIVLNYDFDIFTKKGNVSQLKLKKTLRGLGWCSDKIEDVYLEIKKAL